MGVKKKVYHHDKPQYRDADNNIIFLIDKAFYNYCHEVFIFEDYYGSKFVYNELTQQVGLIKDSWPKIIEAFNKFKDFIPGKNPKSYPVNIRTQAINLCSSMGYSQINSNNRPTLQSLADIFNISHTSLLNNAKRYENLLLSDKNVAAEHADIVKFISSHIFS